VKVDNLIRNLSAPQSCYRAL